MGLFSPHGRIRLSHKRSSPGTLSGRVGKALLVVSRRTSATSSPKIAHYYAILAACSNAAATARR